VPSPLERGKMASYLETRLRKQRHNKAIVNRNNDRRQLLLKQQPDVGDVTEETSGEDVPLRNRAYWEDDESDGYDERIRWIQGEQGQYFYDTRRGPQSDSWGETTPPEGFISNREFAGVTTHFAELLHTDEDEVSRELESAESPLSVAWQAAVQGDSNLSRRTSLARAIADFHNISSEEAGRRLVTAAQAMRSDQMAALAEDGVYTTGYIGHAIRQREEDEAEVEAIESEEAQPTSRRRTMPYEAVGISEAVFNSLSPWGQASLDSLAAAKSNKELFDSFPDVWLSDAGDATYPSEYTQFGEYGYDDDAITAKVAESRVGTPLKKKTKYFADLVTRANRVVDEDNRRTINEYLEKRVDEEGGTHQSHAPAVYAVLASDTHAVGSRGDMALLKEAAREDGLPEEVVKKRAVLYTFEEWMKLKDTLWKTKVSAARTQQESNKEQYGSYIPQRVTNFDESGTGVIGVPTSDWVGEHGSFVREASASFTALKELVIPSSARVWPPQEEGLTTKDGLKFINALQVGEQGSTVQALISSWFTYNVKRLRLRDPVKASNEANWGFGAMQVESAARGISDNYTPIDERIISIDNNGNIGAALNYSVGDDNVWHVGSAGASPKGFSSWPQDEIRVVLDNAINERVGELYKQGKAQSRGDLRRVNDPENTELRKIMKGWKKDGRALQSPTARGVVDRHHATLVFFEFASKFLREGGERVETSGISGYVKDHYKRFGFVNAREATRLNILWSLTTMRGGGSYLPREQVSIDDYRRSGGVSERGQSTWFDEETGSMIDDVMTKSFGTGLNKVAYTEKHDTIKTDNRLDVLQEMLDNLMNKAWDKRYGFTDKKLAQANEQEIKDLQDNSEMDDEEFEEFLEGNMYMLAGTGQLESSE